MPINEEYRFRKDFALLCDLFLFRPQRRRHGSEEKKVKKRERKDTTQTDKNCNQKMVVINESCSLT